MLDIASQLLGIALFIGVKEPPFLIKGLACKSALLQQEPLGCVVLTSLSAVSAHITPTHEKEYWLFPSIAPSGQYLCMTVSALGLVMLAALAIGGLAGAILMVEPNPTATSVPTKRGLETIAASAPSFLLGIGTAGLIKLTNYLGDQAKALGEFIHMGDGAETLLLSLIGGVSFFFIIGVLMGISYQMKAFL